MRNRTFAGGLVGLVLVALAMTVIHAEESDETPNPEGPQFKLASAKAAVVRYQAAVKVADATYAKSLLAAKKECVGDLEPAIKLAMKAQNLDEANAIKAFRDQLQEEIADLTPKPNMSGNAQINALRARLSNSQWQGVTNGATFSFHADGSLTCNSWGNAAGRWVIDDPTTLLLADASGNKYRATVSSDSKYCFWVGLNNTNITIIRRPEPKDRNSR